MPTVHANGIDIWYELRGAEASPPLVLCHGWLDPSKRWAPGFLDALGERHRLLSFDVRGHGNTSAPDDVEAYSMAAYAADLAGLMAALDIEQAHICGSSQGGMIASQFVLDYPERARSLLLCDSTAGNGSDEGPGGAWERRLAEGLERMEAIAAEEGLAALAERRIEHNRANDPRYFEHPEPAAKREQWERERQTAMSLATFVGTSRAMRTRPDLSGRIARLALPALVLSGEWDDFYPCGERDHALIEGSRFVKVLRAAHSVLIWRPEAFVQAVSDFVADVEAGREVAGEVTL